MRLTALSFFRSPVWKKIGTGIIDTLFPLHCLGCGTAGEYLCHSCLEIFPRRERQRCPSCLKKTTPRGETCFACAHLHPLDGLFAGSLYRVPLVSASIHTLKYSFIPGIAKPLGTWLAQRVLETALPLPDICIPIPLHRRRLRFRGFNQSTLLAETLLDTLLPGMGNTLIHHALLRTRFTKPQMKTSNKDERLRNLSGAFALDPLARDLVRGKSIWLIDDVSTTGTTLEECARVLKDADAKSVFGIVLAR